MAAPLGRRFYDVLSTTMYRMLAWLMLLIIAITAEAGTKSFSSHPE